MQSERPEWVGLFRQSIVEEVEQNRPKLDHLLGVRFARYYTLEELQAGSEMMRGPFGDYFTSVIAAGSRQQAAPPITREAQEAATRFSRRPAARQFLAKMAGLQAAMGDVKGDFVIAFMPGMLRRFADKIEADEATRAAAQ